MRNTKNAALIAWWAIEPDDRFAARNW